MSASADDENSAPKYSTPPRPSRPRRASLAELFASRPSNAADSGPASVDSLHGARPAGSSMASAMAMSQQQTHTRRLSLTTLGLSGSPTHTNQTSPFQPLRDRSKGSMGADAKRPPPSTEEAEEDAVDDSDLPPANGSRTMPSSPGLGRRVSFSARAYGNMRSGPGSGGGEGSPGSVSRENSGSSSNEALTKSQSPPTPGTRFREGFNWSESLRNRAERSSVSTGSGQGNGFIPLTSSGHGRTKSGASMSDSAVAPAVPKPPPKAPDHFQERILKGDFYMD